MCLKIWFDGERVKNLNNGPRPVKLSCQWDVSRVVVRTKPQLAGGARPQPTDHRPQTRRRRAMRDCKSPCLRVRKFERIWKPSYQTDQKKSIRLLQKTTRGQLKDCKEAIRNEALFRGPAHFCDSSATMGFIIPAITPGHRPVWMCGTICMVVTRAVILWHFQISNELPFGSCSRRAWTIPSQQKPAQPPPQHHPRVVLDSRRSHRVPTAAAVVPVRPRCVPCPLHRLRRPVDGWRADGSNWRLSWCHLCAVRTTLRELI